MCIRDRCLRSQALRINFNYDFTSFDNGESCAAFTPRFLSQHFQKFAKHTHTYRPTRHCVFRLGSSGSCVFPLTSPDRWIKWPRALQELCSFLSIAVLPMRLSSCADGLRKIIWLGAFAVSLCWHFRIPSSLAVRIRRSWRGEELGRGGQKRKDGQFSGDWHLIEGKFLRYHLRAFRHSLSCDR